MARTIDPEVKAAALAALLAGQGVDQVAATFELSRNTVWSWKRRLRTGELVPEAATRARIGELLTRYLTANLMTLEQQAVTVFRNPEWLLNQSASELAVLHGVMVDKVARLLDAMAAAAAEPEGEGP